MKPEVIKFIKKGIILIVIFLLIMISLNYFYIKIIEPRKQINRGETEWQKYRNTLSNNILDYAFFGDSHAGEGVNPEFINNSFNFAVPSEDYTETYYKIKKIIKEGVIIKNIILEIDLHVFSDRIRTPESLFNELNYYKNFVSYKNISDLKKENIAKTFLKSKFLIIGRGEDLMLYFRGKMKLTEIKLGWTTVEGDFSLETEEAKKGILISHFNYPPNLFEERSFGDFLKILEFANENNIKIYLIKYPLSKEYDNKIRKNGIVPELFYEELFSRINNIISDYTLLDYYNVFFDHSEYFRDAQHLNYIGSEIFSKRIQEELFSVEK